VCACRTDLVKTKSRKSKSSSDGAGDEAGGSKAKTIKRKSSKSADELIVTTADLDGSVGPSSGDKVRQVYARPCRDKLRTNVPVTFCGGRCADVGQGRTPAGRQVARRAGGSARLAATRG